MATTAWYCRTTGNNLNSGGHDSDTARVTRDSATPGTVAAAVLTDAGATYVTSGVLVTDAVNLQIAGASVICEILSVDSETQITLTTSPGDGSYNYRIGGARAAINKVVNSGAGNNARITNADTVGIKGGTYTENTITPSATLLLYSSDEVEWVVDGTGGGAGSDGWAGGQNVSMRLGAFINCVDDGILSSTGTPTLRLVRLQSNGGDGIHLGNSVLAAHFCTFLANGAIGINGAGNGAITVENCRIDGNTGRGMSLSAGTQLIQDNLVVDNGSDGILLPATGGTYSYFINNTVEGNAGDGMELSSTTSLGAGSLIINNLFTNNASAYGVNSSAGAQTNMYYVRSNGYFGNGTAGRNNFNAGTGDITTDPVYTNAGSDDYTIASTGPAYLTGYSALGGNNKINIGAVQGIGSNQSTSAGGGGLALNFGF